jgi:hypothetical protein
MVFSKASTPGIGRAGRMPGLFCPQRFRPTIGSGSGVIFVFTVAFAGELRGNYT